MYQVKNATFNNPTVNRFIFFTLIRLGSLEEAKYALRAYLDLMGVPDFDTGILLNNKSIYANSVDETVNPEAKNSATDLTRPLTTTTKADNIIKRLVECTDESIDSVLSVLLVAIQLYGREEHNGILAAYLSDLALDLSIESQVTSRLDQVYRVRGSSYGLLASQCEGHDDRARHHDEAIKSLEKAVALKGSRWKNHYELGLQQALVRDTHAAILSISKSIELFPNNVDSWHLLALLYSCKRTDDLPKALKTLEAGLQLSLKNTFISASGLPVFSWNQKEVSASELYKNAESYLSIRMSLLTLKEALEGPESVLDPYEELFTTYTQLTKQLGIFNAGDDATTPSSPSTATTTNGYDGRRRKSSLSLIRRTSLTSIANSITSSVSTGTTTTTRRRATSVEEKNMNRPFIPRRAESDTDDFSDDPSATTESTRKSFTARRSRKQKQVLPPTSSAQYADSASSMSDVEKRKKSLQLIDLGLARRIGTAAGSPSQRNGKHQQGIL
jgi:tetratricopeptide (TPR) repeat protein